MSTSERARPREGRDLFKTSELLPEYVCLHKISYEAINASDIPEGAPCQREARNSFSDRILVGYGVPL